MYPRRLATESLPGTRSCRLEESARLQALADYVDPGAERLHQLQELVTLAGRLLRMQSSMLCLVDRDRIIVHALQGTRPLASLTVTPVWEVILGAEPLFVWQADPLEDPGGIPMLTPGGGSPGVFVAAPVTTSANAVIGALCVSDARPRRLSADDRAMLLMLAGQAMSLLELARVMRREGRIRDAEAMLARRSRIAFSLADLGEWSWSPVTDQTVLSPQAARIYGLPAHEGIGRETMRSIIAPEHRERVRRRFEHAIRERRDFHLEFRLRHPSGREVWAQVHGAGVRDEGGRMTEVVGVVHDITARRLAEARMRIREDRAWMKAELINRVQDLDDPSDVAAQAVRVVVDRLGIRGGGFCRVLANGELLPARDAGPANTASLPGAATPTSGAGGEGAAEAVDAADVRTGIGLTRLDAGLMRQLARVGPVEIEVGSVCPLHGDSAVVPDRSAQLCAVVRRGRPVALFWFLADRERGWRDGETLAIQSTVDLASAYHARAQARRAANAGERRLLLVADWMPQLAWLARADGQTVWFNQRWLEYSGHPVTRLVDGGWLALCHPDDHAGVEADFRRGLLASDCGWESTFRLRRADGQYRWHLSRAISFATGRDDEPLLWFGTMTDVTEQRQLAEKRETLLESERLARQEAEAANRLKDEFLATLSHELRTPLTAMLGWTQVLKSTGYDPTLVRQSIEIIERNARIQSQIVDDLLDMSAIVSGKLRLECRTVALRPLIESAVQAMAPLAGPRRIGLRFDDGGEDLHVTADASRMLQVVNNLLTNAIKFSPPRSEIGLTLRSEHIGPSAGRYAGRGAGSEGGGAEQVVLTVSDQGIGMTAEFLPHVFERFRQADGSNTRLHDGLGLGLAIVSQLLELHGGGIEAHSPGPGKGSTFIVRLPRTKVDHAGDDRQPAAR